MSTKFVLNYVEKRVEKVKECDKQLKVTPFLLIIFKLGLLCV